MDHIHRFWHLLAAVLAIEYTNGRPNNEDYTKQKYPAAGGTTMILFAHYEYSIYHKEECSTNALLVCCCS